MSSFARLQALLCLINFLSLTPAHENSLLKVGNEPSIPPNELRPADPNYSGTVAGGNPALPWDTRGGRKLTASEIITLAKKAQGGKGSYGGANVVHRTPAHNSASASAKLGFFNLFLILSFSFYLLLPFQY